MVREADAAEPGGVEVGCWHGGGGRSSWGKGFGGLGERKIEVEEIREDGGMGGNIWGHDAPGCG